MRVSTKSFYESAASRISDAQSRLTKVQDQMAAGKRVLTPADDPVAAARLIVVNQMQAQNDQFSVNRKTASNALNELDDTLASVTSLLHDVKQLVVNAGNGSLNDSDRSSIATELKGRLEDLFGLSNATNSDGEYIFSGFKSSQPAFVKTPTGIQYQGDQGQRRIQVDSSRQIELNDSGDKIFTANGEDMFKAINDFVTLLNTPNVNPSTQADLDAGVLAANASMTKVLDSVLETRSTVGARLREIDSLNNFGDNRAGALQQSARDLQELDYISAVSDFTQQKMSLEAAQQSFVKISGLSLFNFIN